MQTFEPSSKEKQKKSHCCATSTINYHNQQENHIVLHNKSISDLLNEAVMSRKVSPNHIVKICADGGKSFLKISLGISENNKSEQVQTPLQKKFLTQRIAKDTGVKLQILVAVAEDLPFVRTASTLLIS